MLYLQRTILAVAVLFFVPARHPVARVTVVRVAVAEPQGNRTAVPTLEVDVLLSMDLTVLDSCSDCGNRALWTDQVFPPEISCLHSVITTVIEPTKVWLLALETWIERTLEHCIRRQIIEEPIITVSQSVMLVEALLLGSLNGHPLDLVLDVLHGFQRFSEWRAVVQPHLFLTAWTVHEPKSDPWRRPLVINDCLDALDMEDMAAA